MKTTALAYDHLIRVVFSSVYRIFICILGIILVFITPDIEIKNLLYIGTVVYFLLSFIVRLKQVHSYWRLGLDLVYCIAVLFYTGLENPVSYIFYFLPFINATNHSGKKESLSSLLLFLSSYILIGCFLVNIQELLIFLIGMAFIGFILMIVSLREKFALFSSLLNDSIGILNSNKHPLTKLYKIYPGLIMGINSRMRSTITIENIYCGILINERLKIINGSSFVWQIDRDEIQSKKSSFSKKNWQVLKIKLNGSDKEQEMLTVEVRTPQQTYYYLFSSSNNEFFWLWNHLIVDNITDTLQRISLINDLKKSIFDEEQKQLSALNESTEYINYAKISIHSIRGSLTPIKNYIKGQDRLKELDDNDPKKTRIKETLQDQESLILSNLRSIYDETEAFLSQSNDHFKFWEIQSNKIQILYSTTTKIWRDHYNSEILLDIDTSSTSEHVISYSRKGLIIVVSNIIANIKKHGDGGESLTLSEDENYYSLIFKNSFLKNQLSKLERITKEYKSDDKTEIKKNHTFGLQHIREITDDMGLITEIKLDVNVLEFKFTVKLEKLKTDD